MSEEYLGLEDGGGILREDRRCGGVVMEVRICGFLCRGV